MNRVTLVTGANGGVGGFIADYLLSQNFKNVVLHYHKSSDNVASLLKKYDRAFDRNAFQCDLTDETAVQGMLATIKTNFGGIDCLVNVAGVSKNSMSWKITKQDFQSVLEGNVLTSFLCSKAAIPMMREKKFGRIINFSSIVAFTGVPGAAHYCAAKAALVGLTKGMSLELAPSGITVNAVALGYFNAGLIESVPEAMRKDIVEKIPMKRFGESSDIGSAIKYLISDEAGFYTGQVLHLNGGQN